MFMTDTNDPFADRPYVPPTERDEAAEQTPEPTAAQEPEERPAVDTTPAAATEAEPAATQADNEPTIPVVAASEPPAPPASEAPAAPPAAVSDSYTHRYPSAHEYATESAAATTTTETIPPFADNEPTLALPHDGGSGGQPPVKVKKRRGRKLVGALALVVLAGAAGFGGAAGYEALNNDDNDNTAVSSLDTGKVTNTNAPAGAVEQVAAKVLPSVVQINVKGAQESGSGTGIIISSDGEILTNNHVVEVAAESGSITVAFNDGTNAKATIVGRDPKTDIAVIKVEGKTGLSPASLGSSADLKVGQEVVAIGSPFGLESTVTQGIVSALNRPVTSSDGSNDPAKSNTFPAIQTDAAINPGNSGGPLVDTQGNVIGINSAIKPGSSGASEGGSIGLGFAIPIDLAKNVSKQLLDGKKVQHAQIGVTVSPAVSDDGITGVGAEVKEVTAGGAGDKAGLKKGDIITSVNGHAVASSEALVASVRGYQPDEKIVVGYTRDGKKSEIDVTLDSDGGKLGS